jgi:hypothetical protein
MANVLLDLLRSLAVGAVADQARETPQGQSVENEYVKPVVTSLMDAIIPPAAASDASAIPQDLIPADVVMTPAQEQQVLQNASAYEGYPYREGGDAVGANILPIDSARQAQVTQMSPTQLPDMQMGQTPEELRDEVQDFVRMVGGRTQALLEETPEEARQNPEVQKGAAAMATTEALAMKGMDMPEEPMDLGAPVFGPKDVVKGLYPDGKPQQAEPDFFDKAGGFLSDMFNDEETMTRLALAFNSMRFKPDQGLATVLGKRLETLSEENKSNKTIQALLRSKDPKQQAIAQLMMNGMSYKDAYKQVQGESSPAAYRALELRAEAAGLKKGTPEYQKFMAEGGVKKGMGFRVRPDGTVEFTQGGDLPSLTEAQSNALVFSQRMRQSNNVLNDLETQGTKIGQSIASGIPLVGNYLLSDEYQKYDQAKRNFVNAVLRKESGAAIAESEFANAEKQYFPIPGDSKEVIEQKRKNRELAMKLMEKTVPNVERFSEPEKAEAPKPKKRVRYDAQGNRIQ